MEKGLFEKIFMGNLNKNFQSRSKYFDFEFYVFSELGGIVFEINKCLILEFHRASITLTNNLLERLLKLSLIYDEAGIGPKPVEDWGATFAGPNKKYSSISLGNSIEKCKKLDLVTEKEKAFLFDTIRELMRNGFSHADSSKILNGIPDETTMFQGSFSNPTEIKPVTVNQKIIPFMQAVHIENFAKENAANYFDYVFELIKKIDQRLIDRNKKTSI
ncbi:hypothetical protein JKA74_09375 [Marivirga sp. S37H4]|uniref:Uncharacterized protein n=1 Tax=Marivirga aurantiaca TaxID=2802615 RepID=A0A934WYB8_9BACT|nr:hypothetical protein [Marivirga aurantiaca]MBK6265249.1 hypothetical protein [Marivirga aurantiaca]